MPRRHSSGGLKHRIFDLTWIYCTCVRMMSVLAFWLSGHARACMIICVRSCSGRSGSLVVTGVAAWPSLPFLAGLEHCLLSSAPIRPTYGFANVMPSRQDSKNNQLRSSVDSKPDRERRATGVYQMVVSLHNARLSITSSNFTQIHRMGPRQTSPQFNSTRQPSIPIMPSFQPSHNSPTKFVMT